MGEESTPDRIKGLQTRLKHLPLDETHTSVEFLRWHSEAVATLGLVFGKASEPMRLFEALNWSANISTADRERKRHSDAKAFREATARADAILTACVEKMIGRPGDNSAAAASERATGINPPKPRVFIGSSVEGLKIAYAIQQNLEHVTEGTVWNQGVFKLTSNTLRDLTQALTTFDFAIFVFSPDDTLIMREKTSSSVRDNVLFELGLFLGALGPERVFYIMPRAQDSFHLPTDLLGITPGTFQADRSDGNLKAALGPVCSEIQETVIARGRREARAATSGRPTSQV